MIGSTVKMNKMKNSKTILGSLIMIIALLANGCTPFNTVRPSKTITVEERYVTGFTGIDVSTAFTVDITFSQTEDKIEVESNANIHPYIVTDNVGGTLIIKIRNGINIRGNTTLKVHITTTTPLEYLGASDAVRIILLNDLDTDDLTISASDASEISGTVYANTVQVFIDDASSLDLDGTTDVLTADISDASSMGHYDFVVNEANMTLSDASNASLTVNDIINLNASDASIFRYKGTALINNLNLSDASQILKMD